MRWLLSWISPFSRDAVTVLDRWSDSNGPRYFVLALGFVDTLVVVVRPHLKSIFPFNRKFRFVPSISNLIFVFTIARCRVTCHPCFFARPPAKCVERFGNRDLSQRRRTDSCLQTSRRIIYILCVRERFADNGRQNANPETVRVYSLASICVSISIEMENKSECLRTN